VAWPWSALIVVGLGLVVAAVAVATLIVVTRALFGIERPDRRRDWNLLSSSNGQVQDQYKPRSPDHGRGS
jgi:hypothetical protein